MEKFSFVATEEDSRLPLKKIIRARFGFSSRMMTKIKYQNLLYLNGEPVPGYTVPSTGDLITVSIPDERSYFEPQDIPLNILYEDEDFLIINKQPGVTCHPTKGHPNDTIANGITKYMEDSNNFFKIRFINRLDMDTSGVLVIGKNAFTQAELIKQMEAGRTEKRYKALVSGIVENDDFLIDLPIGPPDPGSNRRTVMSEDAPGARSSKTGVRVMERYHDATLLELKLFTGRTHQIRVHLSHIGHPILGDELYGGPLDMIDRQALHASYFSCIHPINKENISFDAPLPEDMTALISNLQLK